jgi:hypothetical protein
MNMGAPFPGLALAALSLAGCVTAAGAVPESSVESISYETGPCFGACAIFKITVDRSGAGIFEGRRFTAVTGERRFTVTAEQFRVFAAQLEPLRPDSAEQLYTGEACDMMATDQDSVDVRWHEADGAEQHLYFYYGCDMERNRAIAERLRSAPDLLPIGDLIGGSR